MKKFLLMLIAVFTLCACSSDSYDDVKMKSSMTVIHIK